MTHSSREVASPNLVRVYLGLGSNLGDRLEHLRAAVSYLTERMAVHTVSSVYETAPVGYTPQPAFLNAVLAAETSATPQEVLAWAKGAEAASSRVASVRWGPRTLDVDLLLYGELELTSPDLVVPHPRLAERAFVLVPLAKLERTLVLPGLGRTVESLLQEIDASGVRQVTDGARWLTGADS